MKLHFSLHYYIDSSIFILHGSKMPLPFILIIAFWQKLLNEPVTIYGNFSELKIQNELPKITRRKMPMSSNSTSSNVGKNNYTVYECKNV